MTSQDYVIILLPVLNCPFTFYSVGTQNCFSTLFYTPYTNIKTSAQNAPKCTIARQKKSKKNFWGAGTAPLPTPLPHWGEGYPIPRPHRPRRLRRLAFPFLFIYDSNTGGHIKISRHNAITVGERSRGQMSVRCDVNIFKTIRLRHRWAEAGLMTFGVYILWVRGQNF